ncbi:MAG: DEAD/DEAH box helicase family protein [Thermoflexales bacterium]|nr:DEAD/DEAH box helicase family protein [Thermoflexales bacterium]
MSSRSEADTRARLIDPALTKAGWDVDNSDLVRIEIPVDGFDPAAWKALEAKLKYIRETGGIYEVELPKGICDYALYRPNGEIVAVVEAKKTSIDPRLAEAQAGFYVTEIARRQSFSPFAFMTNGREIYFWDMGQANKREVAGFFSPDDLENLLYIRRNKTPTSSASINTAITNRSYQQEAIRRVCEAFEQGKRKALLVMATGTGKTRVAMSLVDIFVRTNQARRILFVADRDALVSQAKTDGFETYIPNEPCTRIWTHAIDTSNRLYAATLQTLSNCFTAFGPAFFDLIIFDEVHRSIFNKWNEVLSYFDARMVGLTATPADFIDRNTFLEFECYDGLPTFLYSYDAAVRDGYLVDYQLYAAQTRFQRKGIRGVDLSEEERNTLIQQGLDPDELDFSGTDLETKVSNKGTLRKQWEEIMQVCYKDQSGQLPGKMIVFAMTQEHALRLADAFEEMYPQYPGLVQVITHKSEYKGTLLERFKKEDEPRIAISVDMLETGVDVPEAVNLVFMRPVQSHIKLWQMIGRGTRSHETCRYLDRLPGGHKTGFLVIDFWENNFNKNPQEEIASSLPVLVTIFNTRLRLLEQYLANQQTPQARRTMADLRKMIARIPTGSFSVKKVYAEVEPAWADPFWRYLTQDKLTFLKLKVGPLLRYAPDVDVQAETFTSKVERLKLQVQSDQDASATAQSIAEDVSRLPEFVYEDPRRKQAAQFCLTPQLRQASAAELDEVMDMLAEQMKNRRARPNNFLVLDLPDYIDLRGYLMLAGGSQAVYVDEYRKRVEQRVLDLAIGHPTLEAIGRGEQVDDRQLIELERTLRQTLSGGDVELSEANIRRAYGKKVGGLLEFVRDLLELDGIPDYADIVRREFEGYIACHAFNADQIRFLRAVQHVFLQKRRLVRADLYDAPLTGFGYEAVERWFSPQQVDEILAFTDSLAI